MVQEQRERSCFSSMALRRNLLIWVLQVLGFFICMVVGKTYSRSFVIKSTPYTRLCETKNMLTVNGQYPGPTLYVHKEDTVIVEVYNKGSYNVTIHWHGVKQPRNPWSDGPEYITQCPIQPGASFRYKIVFSSEEGTLWWHAHSDWTRATVHGAIFIYPKNGTSYPFPKPNKEFPIILGEWYKRNVMDVMEEALTTGAEPNSSNSYTINGQPGDLLPCSEAGTFRVLVEYGKTYLLRMINAATNDELFFAVANHKLTVVGIDASYVKPITTSYIMITPGQTMDVLLEADQTPSLYYMAASAYSSGEGVSYDTTTTTAIVQYNGSYTPPSSPSLPSLPIHNDTEAVTNFTTLFRSLADKDHPVFVPKKINKRLIITVSVNTLPCANSSCSGPNGNRLSASLNNISFVNPSTDILQAYHRSINGVFKDKFPNNPPFAFNYTADSVNESLWTPKPATKLKIVEYNISLEIVFQGTNVVAGEHHPMHLHGYSVYVVGSGFGNFDKRKDPKSYNLVDPPKINNIGVPKNGWTAVRFNTTNPGVWFMHCHLDRHLSWGMDNVLIVKNGKGKEAHMLPPQFDMPPC